MAEEHSIIVRTVKYALPVTRLALLCVAAALSPISSNKIADLHRLHHRLLWKLSTLHGFFQIDSSTSMTSRTHPVSHTISTTFLGQNVAEIIKYPCHLFSYKTLRKKYAIALSWKQDMMSLGLYIYILVLTHFHTGHRKPKTRSQF